MPQLATRWRRRLEASDQPAYVVIPELIAEDLRDGRLAERDRLPTLRELARDLDLHYTTVARAFAEARKRGLIDSRSGSGSWVRRQAAGLPLRNGTAAAMTMNMPPEPTDPALLARLREGAAAALQGADMAELLRYHDFGGSPRDRDAAMAWLKRRLSGITAGQVLVCPGIHSVLTALISQLARPGESICVDALVYPGLKAIATQLGVQLHPLPMDDEGPDLDAFEHACRTLAPKAVYCNPTFLNPTTLTMSARRREGLADVALRYSVPIIEDDAYAMLPRRRLPPVATFAPELTYYITGFSKCLGAGLRSAYVCAPSERLAQRLAGAMRSLHVMASPITSGLATRWVEDGTAEAVLDAVRAESIARHALAQQHLGAHGLVSQPEAFHLWLPLASSWSVVEFASYLRTQGAAVVASAAFSTDGSPPDAVRICLGGPLSREDCDGMLRLIAQTLEHPSIRTRR
ncbi:PLP-dependent aminotransferase family protein [Aquabacterium sp. J223]|uniref:aminotransferase-like domain-containing protein n=1 Tax=Aquabacterium sp. J223 TaxID=2898431 RepID=UPI0039170B60